MKRAAYALAAVLILFVLAEVGLRVAGYSAPARVLDYRFRVAGELYGEPDRYRFWRLPNLEPRFTPGAYHIVCLADSVTVMDHGKGYPEDLPAAFARAGFPRRVEAFNAGVPEYSSFQGLVYLERELISTKPDLVTVEFGVNDHWRAVAGVPDEQVHMPSPALMRLHRDLLYSRVYQAVRAGVMRETKKSGEAPLRVSPASYERNLEKIAAISRAAGAKVLFVAAPYLEAGQDWSGLHRNYIDLTKSTGARLGVPVVDVTDRFLHAPELFLEPAVDPIHFTREGGVIIADAIAAAIVQ